MTSVKSPESKDLELSPLIVCFEASGGERAAARIERERMGEQDTDDMPDFARAGENGKGLRTLLGELNSPEYSETPGTGESIANSAIQVSHPKLK